MNTKEIIQTVVKAFDKNDTETILHHMADDAQWHLLGNEPLIGKESISRFFIENPDAKVLANTINNFVVEGNTGVVSGEISCTAGNGKTCDMFYSDIYELENGKIKKLTSYMIDKTKIK